MALAVQGDDTPRAAACPGWLAVAERRGLLRAAGCCTPRAAARRGLLHAAGSGAPPRHATIEMTQ
jgi:hypothetical protein